MTRRNAEPLTMLKPLKASSANATAEVTACGGNPQLMEARLCELTASVRALLRSNVDLSEALADAQDDPDFVQALEENTQVIQRQLEVAKLLVKELQTRGSNIELEDDLQKAFATIHISSTSSVSGVANNVTSNTSDQAASGGIFL